jgi:hypothetical protein
MRRALALGLLALALLTACAGADRPEGVVERWLASLNQGAAGRPELVASDEVSEVVLPDRRDQDPGELDVIEVGHGRPLSANAAEVPFRVVRLDGTELERTAIVRRGPHGWRIERLEPARADLPLPSEGGPPIAAAGAPWWLGALAVALAFGLGAELLMALVRHAPGRRRDEGPARP